MKSQEPSRHVNSIATKLSEVSAEMIQGALMATNSRNKADALYVGTIGIMSQVHVIASIVGKLKDGADPTEQYNYINDGSLLFVSLMAYRTGIDHNDGSIAAELGPHTMIECFGMMEKILGKPAEDYLDPYMVKATREYTKDSEGNLIDFLAKRSAALSSKTLN